MTDRIIAKKAGLANCHICNKLNYMSRVSEDCVDLCSRCGAEVHARKPNSISRTWALIITGFILYIPANVYPILSFTQFGEHSQDTIMSGIISLFDDGLYAIALVVLVASIVVPMAKLIGLSYLLLSVQFKSRWRPKDRTRLYRIIELVGRWSMLDMFVISIFVALLQLGKIATVIAGIGATTFVAVVVITMFASKEFDPRLIWDNIEDR